MIDANKNNFLSVSDKYWTIKHVDNLKAAQLVQKLNINDLLARFICLRDIDFDNIDVFLNPSLKKQLPSPFIIKDMTTGVNRIANAIINKEKIAIFGDYDVDGATSSAALFKILTIFGSDPIIYIPDRLKEG